MIRDISAASARPACRKGPKSSTAEARCVAPGLIDMRAFVGEPGAEYRETLASASQAAAAGGVTTIVVPAGHQPGHRRARRMVDFVLRRARDTAIVHVHPMAALTKGLKGEEMTEIGLLKAAGAVAFTDGNRASPMRRSCAGPDLCARLRRAHRAPHRRSRSRRRGRDERGRVRGEARAARRAESSRDDHARTRRAARRADGRALSRRDDHLRRIRSRSCAGPRTAIRPVTASVSINHLTLNENRRRLLPHVLQARAAAAAETDRIAMVAGARIGPRSTS